MKEYFFAKNGIYYKTNGFRPNRKTLIFIHGHAGSSSAWIKYEEKFEDAYNIVSMDLRGHGKSAKPKKYGDYQIKDFVQDIADLISFLRIEKFILVGHSFGAIVSLEILKKYEDRVLSTIFVSPIFYIRKAPKTRATKSLVALVANMFRLLPFSAKPGIHIDYSKLGYTNDFNPKRVYLDVRNTTLHVYLYALKYINGFNDDAYISKISLPTLIVHGKDDSIMPVKNSIAVSKIIKNCRLILIEKGNHILPLNNFSEVSKAIEDFLNLIHFGHGKI